jgi:DNA modification methylase
VREGKPSGFVGGRSQSTVWDVPKITLSQDDQTEHPTQKPIALYERPIINHTAKGDAVYDAFGGSGTLVMACEKLERRALVMELDPRFVDLIVRRWQTSTGKKATLASGDERSIE